VVGGDVTKSLLFFQNVYGPTKVKHFYATEIPELHGEAFPGMLHLSWVTFQQTDDQGADEVFRAHEVAHQWWGIGVDYMTYHDRWLSEGFAEFSGLWYMQTVRQSTDKYFAMLRQYRGSIFLRKEVPGPIALGQRVQSSRDHDVDDYGTIVYKKGAWVLHMLRIMMLDLKAVLDWNPELAEAYDLLALARNGGGSTTAAMESERAAIGLSPRNETYHLHLAQIYMTGKKYPAATALLERLKTSDNSQMATAASDLLNQMSAEKKYGAAAANAGVTSQPKYEEQKSPFAALDEEAAKRESSERDQPGTADSRATKYVRGRLVAVDCSNAPIAILTVHVGSGTLKLRAADYKSLLLIGENVFDCAWRDRQVTANYKPRGGENGDLVSLEMR